MNISYIKWVIKNEGVYALITRYIHRFVEAIVTYLFFKKEDAEKWKTIKGKYSGKRVFVIGNGPSLNKTPLYLLKDEYTICFNRFYLFEERLNWEPSFYMITDDLVIQDLADEFSDITKSCEYCFLPKIHKKGKLVYRWIKDHSKVFWFKFGHGRKFSLEMPIVYPGGTVIYEAFQVLKYMGFEKIYILGVDMNYKVHDTAARLNNHSADIKSQKDDDPNHFDPRYFGKGRSYHQPQQYIIDNIMESLNFIGKSQEKYGTLIINVGIDSSVQIFPKERLHDVLKADKQVISNVFNEMLANKTQYVDAEDFMKHTCEIKSQKEFESLSDEGIGDFYVNEEIGLSFIKQAIFSYIPYGPYNGYYFFIKRV